MKYVQGLGLVAIKITINIIRNLILNHKIYHNLLTRNQKINNFVRALNH